MNSFLNLVLGLLLGGLLVWFWTGGEPVVLSRSVVVEVPVVDAQTLRLETAVDSVILDVSPVDVVSQPSLIEAEDGFLQDCLRARVEKRRSSPRCRDAVEALGAGR